MVRGRGLRFQHQVRAAERPPQVELKLQARTSCTCPICTLSSGQINTFCRRSKPISRISRPRSHGWMASLSPAI